VRGDRIRIGRRRAWLSTAVWLVGLSAVVGITSSLLGCAALDYQNENNFIDTQKRFTQYVRWGKIAKASEYVDIGMREEFLSLAPELTDLRFTDYEILEMDIADDLQEATVEVRYSGYRLSMPIERSVDLTQEWKRDDSGLWQVTVELEAIRETLLGMGP
jgi:hypothetical protein